MSDNQSWNSSGSEEDAEPRDENGHLVGIVDLSGVLSKVSFTFIRLQVLTSLGQCHCQRAGGGTTAREVARVK